MSAVARQRVSARSLQRSNLGLASRQRTRAVNLRLLRRLTHTLLAELLPAGPFDLGVVLVTRREIGRLNQTFLRHVGATDVIAFNYSEHAANRAGTAGALHGDLVICVDEAVRQARRFRTTWQSELARYLVHGLLHLHGHDDRRPADRRRMKREENRLLQALAARFPLRKLGGQPKLPP